MGGAIHKSLDGVESQQLSRSGLVTYSKPLYSILSFIKPH